MEQEKKLGIEKDIKEKNFTKIFFQLFKFDKSFFMSFIFYIHIIVQILVLIAVLYSTASEWILLFLWAIIAYPLVFFYIRFIFEFITILFSINNNLLEIKENLKK